MSFLGIILHKAKFLLKLKIQWEMLTNVTKVFQTVYDKLIPTYYSIQLYYLYKVWDFGYKGKYRYTASI